jgi:uncharacterized protein YdeI (YjbR/CyaY-like superfamily)
MAPVVPDPRGIKSFRTAEAFEAWLARNHARQTEIWLRVYKKDTNNMKPPAGRAKKIAALVAMLARGETIAPQGQS